MDEIQKVLVEAGRKDLAQKYYKKTAGKLKYDDVFNAINAEVGPSSSKRMTEEIMKLYKGYYK